MRRALLIGLDNYDHFSDLRCCVADASEMGIVLSRHGDGEPNYDCQTETGTDQRITRSYLRQRCKQLFSGFEDDLLFYYSGHGALTDTGGFIGTQDGVSNDPGMPMSELLDLAANSPARTVTMILDCCYAGDLGRPQGFGSPFPQAVLRQGTTILAACGRKQIAEEGGPFSVFTDLVLGALRGGAADILGNVSAAAIYGYAEQLLGPWEQRPIYKSHAQRLTPLRRCAPAVTKELLRELPKIFDTPEATFELDPSFEFSHDSSMPENVALFDKFKILRNARLLVTESGDDLFFTALKSQGVRLTALGKFYWRMSTRI